MPASSLAAPFLGIVGWSADDSLGYGLTTDHTTSDSGLYVTNLNELVSLPVMAHVAPEGESLPEWLTRITEDVVTKLVSRVISTQQTVPTKELLSGVTLLNGLNKLSETVSKQGRFVGFSLTLPVRKGVQTSLHRVSLQLSTKQSEEDGPVKVYVYRSQQEDPLQIIEVTPTRAGYPEWVEAKVDLSAAEAGETLLIGYYEDDLTGFAVGRNWSYAPCQCVNDPFPHYEKNATIQSVSFPAGSLSEDRTVLDLWQLHGESNSFGLNLELSVACSATAVLALPTNRLALAEAIQLALACRVLEGIIGSPQITQLLAREDIQADAMALLYTYQAKLYGGKDMGTEKDYYPSVLKQVALDTTGIDSACLPKAKSWLSVGTLGR